MEEDVRSRIRNELKRWETTFAAQNEGRKPTKADIKADQEIRDKYAQYNRLRASKYANRTVSQLSGGPRTPSKKRSINSKHSSGGAKIPQEIKAPSPQFETPCKDRILNPTPQKEGNILGIFDHLRTPTRRRGSPEVLADLDSNVDWRRVSEAAQTSNAARIECDALATALETPVKNTTGVECLLEDTPIFLRRVDSAAIVVSPTSSERIKNISDERIRKRPPALGRSLSSLVQDLRKAQDEEFDEDAQISCDYEVNATAVIKDGQGPSSQKERSSVGEEAIVEIDQSPAQGQGARWKKKGQKRTTKIVNSKPSTAKWQPEPEWLANSEDSKADQEGAEADNALASGMGAQGAKSQGVGKKRAANPNAHANFRSLKLRNKGTSGRQFGRYRKKR